MDLYMLLEWTDNNMVGMLSKWWNLIKLSPWISYWTPFPIFLLFYASFPLLAFSSALPLSPIPVLRFTLNSCFSCHDLFWPGSSLDWPWASGCSVWLIPSLGSHLSPHSRPMYFCSLFNPVGLLALALRPSPAWTAIRPGADSNVPFFPVFHASHYSVPDSSWSNFPECGWGRIDFESVSDKLGGGEKLS